MNAQHPEFFCLIDDQEVGPLSPQQVRKLARSGNLKPSDQIKQTRAGRWKAAASFSKLFPDSGTPTTNDSESPAAVISQPPAKSEKWTPVESTFLEKSLLVGGCVAALVALILIVVLKGIVGVPIPGSYCFLIAIVFVAVATFVAGQRQLAVRQRGNAWYLTLTLLWCKIPVFGRQFRLTPAACLVVNDVPIEGTMVIHYGINVAGVAGKETEEVGLEFLRDAGKIEALARSYADGLHMRCDVSRLKRRQSILAAQPVATLERDGKRFDVKQMNGRLFLILSPADSKDETLSTIYEATDYDAIRVVDELDKLFLVFEEDSNEDVVIHVGVAIDRDKLFDFLQAHLGTAVDITE